MAAESLNQAAAARHKRTIDRAEQALRQLDAEGAAVSFQSVARRAGVSRQWLYTQPALRREIEVLRDRAPARADSVPARQRASGASLRQRVESLRAENQRLREENQSLKAELAIAYGHQRAAARGSRPSPSRNPKTSEDRLYPSKALIDLPCSSMSERRLVEEWEAQANAWKQWTRTPGHDHHFHRYNWPSFLEPIPPAGRGTLDLGCGEGRAGIALRDLGHRVTGVDAAPALAKLATQTGAYEKVIVADAAALPFTDRSFDLVGCRLIGRKSGICLQIDRDTDFDTPQTTAVVISIGRVFNGAHYPGDVGAPLQRLLSFPRCPVRLEG